MTKKESHENWVKSNRKRVALIQKKYYYRNRKKILERMKNNKKYVLKQRNRVKKDRKEQPWLKHLWNANTRCKNKNNPQYKNYGGRGITSTLTREQIKELWFRDKAYEMKKPSIDRKDNNGNYTFDNCKFIELVDNIKKSNRERFYKTCSDYSI